MRRLRYVAAAVIAVSLAACEVGEDENGAETETTDGVSIGDDAAAGGDTTSRPVDTIPSSTASSTPTSTSTAVPVPVTNVEVVVPLSNPVTLEARSDVMWVVPATVPDEVGEFIAIDLDDPEFGRMLGYVPEGCTGSVFSSEPRRPFADEADQSCQPRLVFWLLDTADEPRLPTVGDIAVDLNVVGASTRGQQFPSLFEIRSQLRLVPETALPRPAFHDLDCCDAESTAPLVAIDNGRELRAHSDGNWVAVFSPWDRYVLAQTSSDHPVALGLERTSIGMHALFGMSEPDVADLVLRHHGGHEDLIPTQDLSGSFRNRFFVAEVRGSLTGVSWETLTARDADGNELAVYDVKGVYCCMSTPLKPGRG